VFDSANLDCYDNEHKIKVIIVKYKVKVTRDYDEDNGNMITTI